LTKLEEGVLETFHRLSSSNSASVCFEGEKRALN